MPDSFEVIKDEKIDEYKKASLEAGFAFDEMTRMKGWSYVKSLIENTIKNFTNKAIIKGFSSFDEYSYERGIVEGQRKILEEVDNKIRIMREENERTASSDEGTSTAS